MGTLQVHYGSAVVWVQMDQPLHQQQTHDVVMVTREHWDSRVAAMQDLGSMGGGGRGGWREEDGGRRGGGKEEGRREERGREEKRQGNVSR